MNRLQLYTSNRPVDVVLYWEKEGFLELDPPYQRGDVWGLERRRNLIYSIVAGIPIASVIVNDRCKTDAWGYPEKHIAVIDGKQRLTTILRFIEGEFSVPGKWFDLDDPEILFSELPVGRRRSFKFHPLAFCEGGLPSMDAEREVFELVNFGGVPQGQTDIIE